MLICTPIFVCGQNKSKVNLKYFSRSTVKPLYLFEVRGQIRQGQSKILAKMSAVFSSLAWPDPGFAQGRYGFQYTASDKRPVKISGLATRD